MTEDVDRITKIFEGKTIFISGATGFLGKILIEKLLRVTEVKTLYLLVRQKKGKTPKDRMHEIFNHVLFSVLKKERPESLKKCVIVQGDVLDTNLGITEVDRRTLQEEVDYIYHSAATTRFDDTLQYSVKMNTLGTKYMLDLAKGCKKLKLFVHISTCFAFPKEKVLYEKTYDPPADPDEILKTIFTKDDEFIAKTLLGDCPNTYTYSKSLAEGLVNKEMNKLPTIIARPAVVIPTWKEPIKGYFNNLQSPMGIFAGAGKGVIRSVYVDSKTNANVIPADSTINGLLVCSWDYLSNKQQRVYNLCIPREDLSMSWEEIVEVGKEVNYRVPFNNVLWYPGGCMTKSKVWHYFNVLLFQLIPAVFVDILLFCLGYKPVLFEVNKRLLKGQAMFEYYTTKAWNFDMKYFLNLRRRLTQKEKQVYKLEAENVNIPEYLTDCMMYARRYIFKETDDMLPAAKLKLKILFVLDRIIKVSFFVLVFYYFYKLLKLRMFTRIVRNKESKLKKFMKFLMKIFNLFYGM